MTKHMYNHRRGFTLIEILVSVGILSVMSILIAQVFFTTTHTNQKTELLNTIKQNGANALDVMLRSVRGAAAIETVCASGVTSSTTAVIRNTNDDTTTFTCMSDGVAARIASVSGEGAVAYITGSTVTLSASGGSSCDDSTLTFSCPDVTGLVTPVNIQFVLSQIGSSGSTFGTANASFQGSATIRN